MKGEKGKDGFPIRFLVCERGLTRLDRAGGRRRDDSETTTFFGQLRKKRLRGSVGFIRSRVSRDSVLSVFGQVVHWGVLSLTT